jgi:3-hydroxybutyryl-CoA dehydratase
MSAAPAPGLKLVGRGRRISAEDVAAFAFLTGDRHPLHRDSEHARNSIWGEPIAPGLLLLSFAIGLLDLDHQRVIALHRLREAAFVRPTRFGEVIRAEASVDYSRRVRPGMALVGLRLLVRDSAAAILVRAGIELLWDDSDP